MHASELIESLELEPHPEGGHYRRLFTSPHKLATPAGERPSMTAIYYLLRAGEHSRFHRLESHELWHWHAGTAFFIHILTPAGGYYCEHVGPGGIMTLAVPPRHWFAAELAGDGDFGLATCTVTPGFDFQDFELAETDTLAKRYPRHRGLIERLGE